jgi:hypothetical protein
MCIGNRRHWDRKTRFIYAAGNFCLAIGVAFPQFAPRLGVHHQILLDGLHGLLLGMSITLLLWVLLLKRKPGAPTAGSL